MGNKELLMSADGGEFAISGQTVFKDTRNGEMVYIRVRRKADSNGKRVPKDIPTGIPSNARGKIKELKALLDSTIAEFDSLWEKIKDKVEVVKPIQTMSYGTRKFIIKDLDGNELAFCG